MPVMACHVTDVVRLSCVRSSWAVQAIFALSASENADTIECGKRMWVRQERRSPIARVMHRHRDSCPLVRGRSSAQDLDVDIQSVEAEVGHGLPSTAL